MPKNVYDVCMIFLSFVNKLGPEVGYSISRSGLRDLSKPGYHACFV